MSNTLHTGVSGQPTTEKRGSRLLHTLAVGLCCCIFLGGCATKEASDMRAGHNATAPAPLGAFALEGPPLHIVASYQGRTLEGQMERHVMVGIGNAELEDTDKESGFFCTSKVNIPPSQKLRIRGLFSCTDNELLFFTLRLTGPDQGVGIARTENGKEIMTIFFHSCLEEARRRFAAVDAILHHAAGLRDHDTQ